MYKCWECQHETKCHAHPTFTFTFGKVSLQFKVITFSLKIYKRANKNPYSNKNEGDPVRFTIYVFLFFFLLFKNNLFYAGTFDEERRGDSVLATHATICNTDVQMRAHTYTQAVSFVFLFLSSTHTFSFSHAIWVKIHYWSPAVWAYEVIRQFQNLGSEKSTICKCWADYLILFLTSDKVIYTIRVYRRFVLCTH